MPKSAEDEKLVQLDSKFADIKTIRDRIINDSVEVANVLKAHLARKKAASPESMTKNLKSISSFLENFSKMMQNLSQKVGSLSTQVNTIKSNLDKVNSTVKSL